MDEGFIRREKPKGQISALVFCSIISFFAGGAFWGALQTQEWAKEFLGLVKKTGLEIIQPSPPRPDRSFDLNKP